MAAIYQQAVVERIAARIIEEHAGGDPHKVEAIFEAECSRAMVGCDHEREQVRALAAEAMGMTMLPKERRARA